jgi:hypothetical protein
LGRPHVLAAYGATQDDERPLEYGKNRFNDVSDNGLNTLHATSLLDLADMLGV